MFSNFMIPTIFVLFQVTSSLSQEDQVNQSSDIVVKVHDHHRSLGISEMWNALGPLKRGGLLGLGAVGFGGGAYSINKVWRNNKIKKVDQAEAKKQFEKSDNTTEAFTEKNISPNRRALSRLHVVKGAAAMALGFIISAASIIITYAKTELFMHQHKKMKKEKAQTKLENAAKNNSLKTTNQPKMFPNEN
jgi:hypothetical protein